MRGLSDTKHYNKQIDLQFGTQVVLKLPAELKVWRIEGKTLDDVPISITAGVPDTSRNLIYRGEALQDETNYVVYEVFDPQALH